MDNGLGTMLPYKTDTERAALGKQYPNHGSVFKVGEIIKIKRSQFRVSKIIRNGLKLELLPKD